MQLKRKHINEPEIKKDFIEAGIDESKWPVINEINAGDIKIDDTSIKDLTREAEVGEIYNAKVVKIEEFGCFVQIWPGCEGLVHISQLAKEHVNKTEDVVKLGDEILVKCTGYDKKGRLNFSRKDALK